MNQTVTIRSGTEADLEAVYNLVRELARYEKLEGKMTNTLEQMRLDGFGEVPLFYYIVAELDGQIVGTAIYFFRYSTFQGKRLYVEDIIVTENYRMMGIGKKLFDNLLRVASDTRCTGMNWLVLDWNTPAMEFYKIYHAQYDRDWVVAAIESKHFKKILDRNEKGRE